MTSWYPRHTHTITETQLFLFRVRQASRYHFPDVFRVLSRPSSWNRLNLFSSEYNRWDQWSSIIQGTVLVFQCTLRPLLVSLFSGMIPSRDRHSCIAQTQTGWPHTNLLLALHKCYTPCCTITYPRSLPEPTHGHSLSPCRSTQGLWLSGTQDIPTPRRQAHRDIDFQVKSPTVDNSQQTLLHTHIVCFLAFVMLLAVGSILWLTQCQE